MTKSANTRKVTLAVLITTCILISSIAYGLWHLAQTVTRAQINFVAVTALMLLPLSFFAGYWFGRTEVRGFLSGVDTMLDRIAKAIDLRDGAKVTVHQRIAAPTQPHPYPPSSDFRHSVQPRPPRLTFSDVGHDQVIDL